MAKSQWSFKTAGELVVALANRQVSAVELAQDVIARIERHDTKINAVCVRDFERALDAARAADAARASGDTRPLLGIPITVKNPSTSPACPRHGACRRRKIFVQRKTRWRSLASRARAASSLARPTCRSG